MKAPSGTRSPMTLGASALALALLLAACGSALAPGATPTPTPGGLEGGGSPGASGGPGGASPGSGGSSEQPSFEEASITHGDRTLLDVDLMAGEMTWDGIIGSGLGDPDRWNINVDILLRRSEQHGGLVFAAGSRFSADWEGRKPGPDDLCQTSIAHWSGAIGTPSGETLDKMSDSSATSFGIVRESIDTIGLDITVSGTHEGEWCTIPGVRLSCPTTGANKLWDTILMRPARLELTCNETSTDNSDQRIVVNVTGLLEEAEAVPTGG